MTSQIVKLSSKDNSLIKHLKKLLLSRKYREETKRCLIFGPKMILELAKIIRIKTLLMEQELFVEAEAKYLVSSSLLKEISQLPTPDGAIAEVEIPDIKWPNPISRLLILDRVQDPQNLGSILRSALAFGIEAITLLEGCADPFHDKAIRSAKGATFHLPFRKIPLSELDFEGTYYAAHLKGVPLEDVTFAPPFALVLGSEGRGIDSELLKKCKPIAIGISTLVESLNVGAACAIFLWKSQYS